MASMIETLGIDIERLSVDERLQLLGEIWDSVAASPDQLPLAEEQRQDLDRRLAEIERNPNDVVPWEEIKAQARARFQR